MDRNENRRRPALGTSLRQPWLIGVLLALGTLAFYAPAVLLDFVNYDDPDYVTSNPHVLGGLSWSGIAWAFTQAHSANWHPLTWLSHMLDVQVYGLNPAGHHLTNVVLHIAGTVLLFAALRGLTGSCWRSALVSALFALHPLHVESVAWISERKDVLSGVFFMLTLWAYAGYARRTGPCGMEKPKPEIRKPKQIANPKSQGTEPGRRPGTGPCSAAWFYYGLAVLFFALGLMSKPMLVTVPCLLLLLDYWPLGRFGLGSGRSETGLVQRSGVGRLVGEKLPFLLLSAGSCVVTLWAQKAGGAVAALEQIPLGFRLQNALVAYVDYIGKLLWPADLSVMYPYDPNWPMGKMALSVLVLGAVSYIAFRQRKVRPQLGVGWAWYLGMLVPVIGLVQVGTQSIADRYMYLPAIGLFIVAAWAAGEVLAGAGLRSMGNKENSGRDTGYGREEASSPLPLSSKGGSLHGALATGLTVSPRLAAGVLVVGLLLTALGGLTAAQLRVWQNTETLFRHAIAVNGRNFIAYNNLGFYLADCGEHEAAKACYRRAFELNPGYEQAYNNLGCSLLKQQRYDEAVTYLQKALELRPGIAEVHNNLGTVFQHQGRLEDAIAQYEAALRLRPDFVLPHLNLANLLAAREQFDAAQAHFEAALRLNPRAANGRNDYASMLRRTGRLPEAEREYRAALELQPGLRPARCGLGEVLALLGQPEDAAAQFAEALRLNPNDAAARLQLGIARATQGRLEEASGIFAEALRLNPEDYLTHYHLAVALDGQRRTTEAVRHYREALRLEPDFPQALNNLAWILAAHPAAEVRDGAEAARLAERACTLTDYKEPLLVGTLAAACAEAGRFEEAVKAAEKARDLAEAAGQSAVAARNRELLELYRAGKAYHEPGR